MTKKQAWRKRGFQIQPEWSSWDKRWFERAGKNAEKLQRNRESYNSRKGNVIGFIKTLAGLKRVFRLNLTRVTDPLVKDYSRAGPVEILDSGAGYGLISTELLARYGPKARVTALGWEEMPLVKTIKQEMDAVLKRTRRSKIPAPYDKARKKLFSAAQEALPLYSKMRSRIKRARVFFENFTPRKQYDVIVDLTGPAWHTGFHTRTLEQVFNLLKPNGTAILWNHSTITKQAFELGNPQGKYAKETGYYLVLDESITEFDVYKKVPVTKNSRAPKRNPKYPWIWSFRYVK